MSYKRCFNYLRQQTVKPRSSFYKDKKKKKKLISQNVATIERPISSPESGIISINNNRANNICVNDMSEDNYDEGNFDMNILEFENINGYNDLINSLDFTSDDLNEYDIHAALLAMFYSCKMRQSAFKTVLNLMRILSPYKLPASFDTCSTIFNNYFGRELSFNKTWLCKTCNVRVSEVSNRFIRKCDECKNT